MKHCTRPLAPESAHLERVARSLLVLAVVVALWPASATAQVQQGPPPPQVGPERGSLVIVGGATWAFGSRGGHMGGVSWGRGMVLAGFAGAFVVGAAAAIVNVGFGLGD